MKFELYIKHGVARHKKRILSAHANYTEVESVDALMRESGYQPDGPIRRSTTGDWYQWWHLVEEQGRKEVKICATDSSTTST